MIPSENFVFFYVLHTIELSVFYVLQTRVRFFVLLAFFFFASGKETTYWCWRHKKHWFYPWRRRWQPTPVFLTEKSHGQRRLVGYSPWGLKELDTAEHTTVAACFLQRNRQTCKWRFRCKLSRLSLWIHFLLFLPDSMALEADSRDCIT